MPIATAEDVEKWKREAKRRGAAYIISVWDLFSNDDYPVYVMSDKDLNKVKKRYNNNNMQAINEIIVIK